ncbi:Histone H1 [Melia azedarach]|uniref:Histone H1 n=1 Tax=Melia azedarach TaxID=155640 RepID=A0ACC1XSU1_MELAZ|nr:Histone H1 [Melia azedarach]
MAAEGEIEVVTVEPAAEEPEKVSEEEKKPKAAPKEKKPKTAPKERKSRAAPKEKKPRQARATSHPPYLQMITDALLALNDKSGSSPYAIAKYMEEQHKAELPGNFRKILAVQLKNFAAKGKLIKIRASYKLSESGKKDLPKTTTVKRTRSATAASRIKAESVPMPPKKAVPVKGKRSKVPKSIKSAVVKKVMKISA